MFTVLGIACVTWTGLELHRIVTGSTAESVTESVSANSDLPGRRQFAAWDDRGRPITVEDLGHA